MTPHQPGILAELPPVARYLTFDLRSGDRAESALSRLAENVDGESTVVGLGEALVLALGKNVDLLRTLPAMTGPGVEVPSTPSSLFVWLRGTGRGDLIHETHRFQDVLGEAFDLTSVIDAFTHQKNRDLTGYEDGTENPEGDDAVNAAILQGAGDGLDGSSFIAIQQWVHDFETFNAMSTRDQDDAVGRRRSDNVEFKGSPPSAHTKRTGQESFDPEAFVWRRSMPWADEAESGLVFVAFGKSFDAFEAQMTRMAGLEDGIVDGLFQFTQPVTGAYFWCPPVSGGKLDLSAVGL